MNNSLLLKEWLKKADEDYFFASNHLEYENTFFGQICFHFHQAVEKYLKTYIIANDLHFRKIHNLKELWQICKEKSESFEDVQEECIYLNQFYLETRYPVLWSSSYTKEEAYKAKESAEKVRKLIINNLPK
jgi:HEPN domain-containing protein